MSKLVSLVLNASYEELHYIAAEDALIHLLLGRAELEEAHPELKFRSVSLEFPVPVVIRLKRYVPQRGAGAQLNRHNLYIRDNYTCQYCDRHVSRFHDGEFLTRDHVVPRDQGGQTVWDNLVTACSSCNGRKDNRTPEEAGMRLARKPVRPANRHIKAKKRAHRR